MECWREIRLATERSSLQRLFSYLIILPIKKKKTKIMYTNRYSKNNNNNCYRSNLKDRTVINSFLHFNMSYIFIYETSSKNQRTHPSFQIKSEIYQRRHLWIRSRNLIRSREVFQITEKEKQKARISILVWHGINILKKWRHLFQKVQKFMLEN